MHHLFLLRHAKSSWANPELEDFDRPLNARGQKAAGLMGAYLAQEKLIPDIILCSAAARTRETLSRLLPFFIHDVEIRITNAIYHARHPDDYRDILLEHSEASRKIMLIGHNPVMEDFARQYAKQGSADLIQQMNNKFPTGSLAEIEFPDPDWISERASGILRRFVPPRSLG
ncbi:SixA phosphatase family protein [Aestuariispira insulae]|uniref:Phosphohistidine phosphatase n=1 Tax=Aestuariispira insulae TaxID=1461337 RepID=A0A3D9HN35_9PROT|nr:histidine phosphatase family protein [Aestuariispira insulae]RED50879.1 phosphohistidine phosphatase [Aestuariispira insulae]